MGYSLVVAVGDGSRVVPGVEDRLHRLLQQHPRVVRHRFAGGLRDDRFEVVYQLPQRVGLQFVIELNARLLFRLLQRRFESILGNAEHHVAEALEQPAERIQRGALVLHHRREPVDGCVRNAHVQDGVHHPRHRDGCA